MDPYGKPIDLNTLSAPVQPAAPQAYYLPVYYVPRPAVPQPTEQNCCNSKWWIFVIILVVLVIGIPITIWQVRVFV